MHNYDLWVVRTRLRCFGKLNKSFLTVAYLAINVNVTSVECSDRGRNFQRGKGESTHDEDIQRVKQGAHGDVKRSRDKFLTFSL